MRRTVLNYLAGLAIFILFDCGLVVVAYLLIKEVTNGLSRNMSGNDILLALIIFLGTTALLPLGTLRIVHKLRENGQDQVVHGMFLGLVLLVVARLITGEIQERKEKQLLKASEAQSQADNEGRKHLEKELEQTRRELRQEASEIPAE